MRIIPIDKQKNLCYTLLVNKSDSYSPLKGGIYGSDKNKALPKTGRDPHLHQGDGCSPQC